MGLPHQATLPVITHLASPPRFRDVLLQTSFHFKHNKHKCRVSHLGFTFHKEVEGNRLTCFLRHGPKPRDEPQQEPREAYLEAEQLLSLSPPGFTAPSVQHHPRSSSSGHDRVWHPIYHRAGHGALVRPSGPAVPPVVVQRFESAKQARRSWETSASAPGQKLWLIRRTSMKITRVTSEYPVDKFRIKHNNAW